MKTAVLGLMVSFVLCGSALADSNPGLYQKMMSQFQAAQNSVSLADFPTLANRGSMTCTFVMSDDSFTNNPGYMFQLSVTTPSGGPEIPPQTMTKPIFANLMVEPSSGLISSVINATTYWSAADGFHIHVAETSEYSGSPVDFVARKGKYIYFTQSDANANGVGYCYPSQ